jgi:hypothetical protein
LTLWLGVVVYRNLIAVLRRNFDEVVVLVWEDVKRSLTLRRILYDVEANGVGATVLDRKNSDRLFPNGDWTRLGGRELR